MQTPLKRQVRSATVRGWKSIAFLIALPLLASCATLLTGGKPTVAHGAGQIAVDSYRTIDKVYIATRTLAERGGVAKQTLQNTLDTTYAVELSTDLVFTPKTRALGKALTPAQVISDATVVLASVLEMAATDAYFEKILKDMQPDRQTLTEEELSGIHALLLNDRTKAQAAVTALAD